MFGTAFDPPIPATVQPAILIIITLVLAFPQGLVGAVHQARARMGTP